MEKRVVFLGEAMPHEAGQILSIDDSCPDDLLRRFFELGISKGARVVVDSIAPLGDPISIRIKGYTLSLRRSEANLVKVALDRFSLVRALPGETVAVESVHGVALSSLLAAKGIREGTALEVADNRGPVFVRLAGSSSSPIRLGKGQASKVIVRKTG